MHGRSVPTTLDDPGLVAAALQDGSVRALARAISWLEADDPRGPEVLAVVRRARSTDTRHSPRPARRVGVTGAPGSGKSTLVDRLVAAYRAEEASVAVIAVDPSSPFSGGALLGDRIRMTRWHADRGVYVRSMASRGRLGGLAAAVVRVAALLEAAGYRHILIETVGVGQSEVDIASMADSTVLVLAPGAGDDVQAFKAGVMEVADIVVVAKADLPGADRLRHEVLAANGLAELGQGAWQPPVVLASASDGSGIGELRDSLDAHHTWLAANEDASGRERRRASAELASAVRAEADRALAGRGDAWLERLARGEVSAERAARALLAGADDEGDAVPSKS